MSATKMMPPSTAAGKSSPALAAALAMTQHDVDRMTEASRALQASLAKLPVPTTAAASFTPAKEALTETSSEETKSNNATADNANTTTTTTYLKSREAIHKLMEQKEGTLVLHGMLLNAAKQCRHDNALIEAFTPLMKASGANDAEANAGIVIFHELDKSSKLKLVFEVLASAAAAAASTEVTSNDALSQSQETVAAETEKNAADAVNKMDDDDDDDEDQHHHKENSKPSENSSDTTAATATASSGPKPTVSAPQNNIKIPTLDKDGALSLFQTILLAITCSVHDEKGNSNTASLKPTVTKDDDSSSVKSSEEPPKKVSKSDSRESPNAAATDATTTNEEEHSPASLQAPSFDTSMASLKDESDNDITMSMENKHSSPSSYSTSAGLPEELQKEIRAAASLATTRLVDYASKKKAPTTTKDAAKDGDNSSNNNSVAITFEMFGDWYNSGGCAVVPWLELLHLSKWKITAPPPSKPAAHVVPPSSSMYSSAATMSSPSSSRTTAAMPMMRSSKHQLPTKRISPKSSAVKFSHNIASTAAASMSSMIKEDEDAMRKMGPARAGGGGPLHASRTVVSFDFSTSADGGVARSARPMCISISEENLWVLRGLVYRSGLIYRSAAEVCKTILRMSHKRIWDGRPLVTLRRDDFRHVIGALLHPASGTATATPQNRLSATDMENFGSALEDFFACFEGNFHQSTTAYHPLSHDEVNVKELAVGFCFLCAGNKSTKLATGFELLDDARSGFLTHQQLLRFLRSYLTMLVAMSLLKENHAKKRQPLSHQSLQEIRAAVENGAHWTLAHFLKNAREKHPQSHMKDAYSFEIFAEWYSKGGYAVAPWLELLDLNKLVSLIGESKSFAALPQAPSQSVHSTNQSAYRECRSSHRRTHHNRSSTPSAQVLFTFPLANQRSLIVLREDAVYVRGVVEQLGVLSLTAESIWTSINSEVKKRLPSLGGPKSKGKKNAELEKNFQVDQRTFVEVMEAVLISALAGKKREADGTPKLSTSVRELLTNFFHSYDLKQSNNIALNELMGGLTLLCGGKKSSKLAFSFGVFDGRASQKGKGKGKNGKQNLKSQSLDQGELFLFLRSFLIALFSCCCQTLDMSDSSVDRYIADTAKMVADDVIRYQWHARKKDRVDFDDFGEWYNEGGFEIAPWLELLDLKKWVLVDNFDALDAQNAAGSGMSSSAATTGTLTTAPSGGSVPTPSPSRAQSRLMSPSRAQSRLMSPAKSPRLDPNCPPPPPEDVLDDSFFEDNDADDIMHMDSIDEMDIMLMPSHDKDDDLLPESKFSHSPSKDRHLSGQDQQSLKFHLASEEEGGGYMLSISQKRIRHLRQILWETGIHKIDPETACSSILSRASGSKKPKSKAQRTITKKEFLAAFREILGINDKKNDGPLSEIMSCIFAAFDVKQNGKPNALELACGFTVLCQGKKSDKLEYAFEVLDRSKNGQLSKDGMHNYMRSFLTVLVSLACAPSLHTDPDEDKFTTITGESCERNTQSVIDAVETGSKWAVSQAFKTGLHGTGGPDDISFDDFGQWYTQSGYTLIPWIELLDLSKWCV